MSHDPLVLALMVAVLALQLTFKLLDSRKNRKENGSAGKMSKEAWMIIFGQLFEDRLKPFQDKHERLINRLETMTESFQTNRQIIVDKLDKILEKLPRK